MTYFSDGVSEEILETVSRNTDLKVISRASSFQFRGSHKATRHVAAELNVSHVLDGSVRRSGSHVRISAQLVECASETRIWSERYDRDLEDVFALQDEIAVAVAEALKAEFSRAGPSPGKVDPAAYDLYLRTRDELATRPLAEKIEMLEQCIALAPDFANGWAALALVRTLNASLERDSRARGPLVEQARTALVIAERLDPAMGLTRTVREALEPFAAYQRREALVREALRLAPGDPGCLSSAANLLAEVGRSREALALAEEAKERDPLSTTWLLLLENYDEQAAQYDALVAKRPAVPELSSTAAVYAAMNGDWSRYEALKQRAWARPVAEPLTRRMLPESFRFFDAIRDGDRAYLDDLGNRLLSRVERTGTVRVDSLVSVAFAGQVDTAFNAVERATFDGAYEIGGRFLLGNWWMGAMFGRLGAPLIADPRFLRFCGKLGLVHYWLETGRWPDCADRVRYDFRAEAQKVAAEGLARHV
jgi:TolB-like protein